MAPVHPLYIPQDTEPQSSLVSSLSVLRTIDNERFIATEIPPTLTKDKGKDQVTTPLAPCILPSTAVTISRILNHPHIISLIDIQTITALAGSVSCSGPKPDITIWEDMNAGCLSYLLPRMMDIPDFSNEAGWHALAAVDHHRFSLPESLCWHVLLSISKALLWLHYGIKETEGIRGEAMVHDHDWQAILIRDISPGQIWFKKARGGNNPETYGECKLGGFQWAKVTGNSGAKVAIAPRMEPASRDKMMFWAPEIYKHTSPWSRAAEVWSLGATVYMMMTGMPPPRYYDYNWQISRMTDKGFSVWLRKIVGSMLSHHIRDRPNALGLVAAIEDGWGAWRANTKEGREYVDFRDAEFGDNIVRNSTGQAGRVGAVLGL